MGNSRQILLLKLSSKSVMMSKTKPFLHSIKNDEVKGHKFLECKTSASSFILEILLPKKYFLWHYVGTDRSSFDCLSLACGMVLKAGVMYCNMT